MTSKNKAMLAYIYFALISLCKSLNMTQDNMLYVVLYVVGTICVFIKIINESYTLKELLSMCFLVLVTAIIAFVGKNLTALYFAISIISLKNTNIKNVLKVLFVTKLIGFSLLFTGSLLGIIENNAYIMDREIIGITARYSFGYLHPNITHMHFLTIIILFYYLYKNKTNLMLDFILLVLNYLLYTYTYSRTSFYISTLFLFYHIIIRFKPNIKSFCVYFSKYSFFIFFALSIALAMLWPTSMFVREIDRVLTGRIYYTFIMLERYSIPLIGGNLIASTINYDNGYFGLLYQCGMIFTVYLLFYMFKLTKKYTYEKKEDELIILFFMSLLGFTENIIYTPVVNFSILFLADVIFPKKQKIEDDLKGVNGK